MRYTVITLGCLAIALCVSPAMALTIAGDGTLTDWGIRPFFDWTPNPGVVYTEANDYSPVNYPGIGYVPSPGGTQGEKFDAEWLGWRVSGGNLYILAVTSFAEETYMSGWNYSYRVGDLFLDVNGNGAFDYALISHNFAGHNFTPGDLYAVQSTQGIASTNGGWGAHPDIANQTNPWVLKEGDFIASGSLARASFDYGDLIGNPLENNTQLWEWGISLAYLDGLDLSKLTLHLTLECGNDVITTPPPVPEPATLMLVSSGLVGLSLLNRKRRK